MAHRRGEAVAHAGRGQGECVNAEAPGEGEHAAVVRAGHQQQAFHLTFYGAHGMFQHRPLAAIAAVAARQQLVGLRAGPFAVAAAESGRQQHGADAAHAGWPQASCWRTGRVTAAPFFSATISASSDRAISGGVWLPMGRPMGPCRRVMSAAARPR
ncbi:hypothetical protein D3C78_602100 [compost metagenome]